MGPQYMEISGDGCRAGTGERFVRGVVLKGVKKGRCCVLSA